MEIDKGKHTGEENQWVFDNESYSTDDGIDLDTDKIEQVMKPRAGARYVGDVRDKGFIPVGFKESIREKKNPNVEFKKPGIHKKTFRQTIHLLSKIENIFWGILEKIRI